MFMPPIQSRSLQPTNGGIGYSEEQSESLNPADVRSHIFLYPGYSNLYFSLTHMVRSVDGRLRKIGLYP